MKLVAASGVDVAAKCLVAVLVLLLTLGLVLVPLGLAAVAPATSARVLAAVGAWMTRHRRAIQVVLGVGFGCWLTAKGLLAR